MTDSIDWYFDPLPGPAFSAALRDLRTAGPVVATTALGGALPIHYIVGYDALAEAFRAGDRFPPAHAYQIISEPYIGQTFMSMEETPHGVWRPPMMKRFRRRAIDALGDDEVAALATELLDALPAAGEIDLVPTFTHRFAFAVICRQLGLPREREDAFYGWSMDLMFGGRDLERSRRADAALTEYVMPVVEARRREPRDDAISDWLATDVEGEPIGDASILSHIRLVFTAGATTTSDALGNLLHALGTHPAAWEAVAAEPERAEDAVQELLRWNPPVAAQPRFVRPDADAELAGTRIPANSAVLFGIHAAHRDPAEFPEPDHFDLERRPKELLTFGPGLRTCPGMHLAQKNLRIGLRELARRLPGFRLTHPEADAPRGILLRGPAALRARW
ncbi:MAG: cytochrome P450 [Myxococcales bacterium]|nr:cytochrome P450 [Myxococcales bacterium]